MIIVNNIFYLSMIQYSLKFNWYVYKRFQNFTTYFFIVIKTFFPNQLEILIYFFLINR